jgi:hypothetical protein
MSEKIVGIIANHESDIAEILNKSNMKTIIMKPDEIGKYDLDSLFSIAILGGSDENPIVFRPRERVLIEKQLKSGKRIFSEYCSSIGFIYSAPGETTRFERLVFTGEEGLFGKLQTGDVLDDQCNTRIKPHDIACSKRKPILQYSRVKEHNKTEVDDQLISQISDRALWFDDPETLLVCNFRLSNFVRARFSPAEKWKDVIQYILNWLCEADIEVDLIKPAYRFKSYHSNASFETQLTECINKSIAWFIDSDMLINEGKDGVKEGLGTEVYPDGKQRIIESVRNDCTAETSFAFFANYLLSSDKKNMEISDHLASLCFDLMQYKEDGPLKGMLRWTQEAWEVCYQDDAARVIISQLLKCLYTGKKE